MKGTTLRKEFGAMKTTPTGVLEALTTITPLDNKIKETATKTAMGLHGWGHWEDTGRGHSQIIKQEGNSMLKETFGMPKDRMITSNWLEKKFETRIDAREEWNTESVTKNNDIVWYTDGSRKNGISGAGWYCGKGINSEGYKHLGRYPTINQAEIVAISDCTQEMINQGITRKKIVICTDSQGAIKALDKVEMKSRLTNECKTRLNELVKKGNKVTLKWVPGHSGVKGNEEADRLANLGSDEYAIGPEPIVPLPETAYKERNKKMGRNSKMRTR